MNLWEGLSMNKYSLFIVGNKTKQVFIRFFYDKKHNYAVYYHFYDGNTYISPLVTNESEEHHKTFTSIIFNKDCIKQLYCCSLFNMRRKLKSTLCNAMGFILQYTKDEEYARLQSVIDHQRKVFYSIPQPNLIKSKFEDPRG